MSRAERMGLGMGLALGIFVRAWPILSAAGPVGDGGLIYAMVEDIRGGGLRVPTTTSYNGLDIPFVYPPLALNAAAVLGEVSGAPTLALLTWLPLLISIGTLVTFAWLAWRVLPPVAAIGATFAFALMPHAYDWVIAGGGLTRGAGLLAALIAMALAAERQPASFRTPIFAGIALGIALLSHPQAAIFGAIGCMVLSWSEPIATWARNAAIAAAAAILVALPWLLGVIGTHGLEALASPANRFEPLVGLVRIGNLRFSGAPFMDVFAVFGAAGAIVAAIRGPRRVPLLLLLIYLAGAGGGEFLAAAPWALCAGIGVAALVQVVLPQPVGATRRYAAAGIGAVVIFLAVVASLAAAAEGSSKLHALSAGHHEAMAWLADNTDPRETVLVPTAGVWGDDEVSEWLPALADHHSIGTVQGSEWLGAEAFDERLAIHNAIRDCTGAAVDCYAAIDPDALIFIPKGQLGGPFSPGDCCPALRESVDGNGYTIIYDGPGATIARPAD